MDRKRLYMTVEEKEQFKALTKKYGLEELTERFRQEPKPKPQKSIKKRRRGHTN